ncbi:BUD13 homolog [Tetranychus urticae]|uniref:BUD13 homolog n=1 Tax=Tetranychus urticae TaxID=32264 RepID=T1KDT5_TETUR|nr:BUD13 homolog [Tetranychus urticae]
MSSKSYPRPIDHKEYLRIKYGAGEDLNGKPKKRRKKEIDEISKETNFKIFDDDIELKKIRKKKVIDDLDVYFGVQEDRPVVEDVIDERPLALKHKDGKNSKWKPLHDDKDEDETSTDVPVKMRSVVGENKADIKKKKVNHGLTSAGEMREERKRLKEEEARMLEKLDPQLTGKGAKSVYRDKKTGRVRDLEKEAAREKEKEAKHAAERQKFKEKTAGLKQIEETKKRIEDEAIEMEKPLARYEDDADLEAHLKELCANRELHDDPMAAYFREKKQQKDKEDELSGDKKSKLVYKGSVPAPPNRFNIPPGHRWDGVNRSNGYEQKYFASLAEKEAIKEEAYRWSTEDM